MTDQTETECNVCGYPIADIRALEAKAEAWERDALRYAQNADFWRAALDQERADNERLTMQCDLLKFRLKTTERELVREREARMANEKDHEAIGALRSFAQQCDKESNVCQWIDPVELRLAMHRGGLLDHNGQPTALLSGRVDGSEAK